MSCTDKPIAKAQLYHRLTKIEKDKIITHCAIKKDCDWKKGEVSPEYCITCRCALNNAFGYMDCLRSLGIEVYHPNSA